MLARITSKNQLTLPETVMKAIGNVEYFDVAVDGGRIVLTPIKTKQTDAIRAKLDQLPIAEADLDNALAWARRGK